MSSWDLIYTGKKRINNVEYETIFFSNELNSTKKSDQFIAYVNEGTNNIDIVHYTIRELGKVFLAQFISTILKKSINF